MTARRPGGPTKRQIAASLAFYGGAPMPAPAPKREQGRPEAEVLSSVLAALRRHPAVAWCERVNSGVVQVDGRWIRYGWVGASDVLGQMRDGRLLAVECKSATGRTTEAQDEFLARVLGAGGVAFVARSADDAEAALSLATGTTARAPLQPLKTARTTDIPSAAPIARQRAASQAADPHPFTGEEPHR